MKCNGKVRLAALVCLAWVASASAVVADTTTLPTTGMIPEISPWQAQGVLLAAGVTALAVLVAMVPVVPLRRATAPAGEQNGNNGNGHSNGHNGGNGHANPSESRAEIQNGSYQTYRDILEGTKDFIYVHDLEGRFTLINPAGLKFLGYTVEEALELKMEQVVAPEYRGVVWHMIETELAAGKSALFELALIAKDGQRRMVEISANAVQKDGRMAGVQGIARDVTARKRAEVAAAEGSELLDVLLENSKELIYFKDRASRLVRYSKSMAKHFGVNDPRALEGKSDFDFFTKDHAQAAYEDEQEVMRTGVPVVGKLEVETHRDGRVTWARTTKVPWCDKSAKIIGIVGISMDVTALKETEDRLAAEQELLRTLLENVPDSIYFKDLQSRFVRVSKSMAQKALQHVPDLDTRTFRRDAAKEKARHSSDTERLIGLTDFDMFTEEHARPAYDDEQEIIRTDTPIIDKLEKETHPDGKITWSLTSKMPWHDADGNIIGTFGISKDVTATKVAEQKLANERGLFQSLLDTFPDTIYFKDRESRFLRVSRSKLSRTLPHARNLYLAKHPSEASKGWPAHLADENAFGNYLIGKTDFDTYEEEFARKAFEEEQDILNTGKPVIGKLECVAGDDGPPIWFIVTKMPWRDKDGKIVGTFGLSRDVTGLKQAQAELEVTHKRLVQASRMAGMAEVATDVLHNVGNVLNSVNVSCSLVIDRVQETSFANLGRIPQLLRENAGRLDEFLATDERGKHIPEYITSLAHTFEEQRTFLLHELNQLRNHIDHIKQVVAMQQNYAKVAGVEETIEVSQLVDDALHINADALTRHAVTYQREFELVPPVYVDKHKVLQILVNLIRNAKYALSDSPRRDKQMFLRIVRSGEDRVQIQVADNGVGIAPDHLTRIFGHGFTTRKEGHGFGLHSGALAAKDLGGSLSVHSDGPDKGATFILELPLKHKQPAS